MYFGYSIFSFNYYFVDYASGIFETAVYTLSEFYTFLLKTPPLSVNIIYYYLGNYDKAKDFVLAALDIWQKTQNKKQEAYSLNSLGLIYLQQSLPEKAESSFDLTLKLANQIGDLQAKISALNNLSMIVRNIFIIPAF